MNWSRFCWLAVFLMVALYLRPSAAFFAVQPGGLRGGNLRRCGHSRLQPLQGPRPLRPRLHHRLLRRRARRLPRLPLSTLQQGIVGPTLGTGGHLTLIARLAGGAEECGPVTLHFFVGCWCDFSSYLLRHVKLRRAPPPLLRLRGVRGDHPLPIRPLQPLHVLHRQHVPLIPGVRLGHRYTKALLRGLGAPLEVREQRGVHEARPDGGERLWGGFHELGG
mmetsp:Transcript_12125/g.30272  ORF Transcript_12125/g.30272 Transcript_12125/m.30272 type:complete len:220 (-) Transcript_12125:729-1388(-)